jgi:AcrR family transcriptional regulator
MATDQRRSAQRKQPQQERSREMVAKIVAATAALLRTVEPDRVTTNLIAEKADVSKGSIYQYFSDKDEIFDAAIKVLAAEEGPAIEDMLRTVTLAEPAEGMHASIDILIDYTIKNRKVIRYFAEHPGHGRTFDDNSGLPAALLAMGTLHTSHYRDRYRSELPPRSLAWLFFNMAVATTLRYIEADDPIPLEDLRSGLKFAAEGLLARERE